MGQGSDADIGGRSAAQDLGETPGRLVDEAESQSLISKACQELDSSVARLVAAAERVPQSHHLWSPSPSARNVVEQVAHAAWALEQMRRMILGTPFAAPTTAEGDRIMREFDAGFKSLDEATELLHTNASRWKETVAALSISQIDDPVKLPYGLGEAPRRTMLEAGAAHTLWHLAQVEYLQTVMGDRDWGF